jgi:hypothetical protein
MREVRADEVRAICEAGGEVTDKSGEVFYVVEGRLWIRNADGRHRHKVLSLQLPLAEYGPYRVTKEPPAKTEPTSFATKLEALAWMAANPGRSLLDIEGDEFWVSDHGFPDGTLFSWEDAIEPFTVFTPEPKPATDEELAAWVESNAAYEHWRRLCDGVSFNGLLANVIRTRRIPGGGK